MDRPADKIKVPCRLVPRGSPEAEAAARQDLCVPDPPGATAVVSAAIKSGGPLALLAREIIADIAAGYRKSWRRGRYGYLTAEDVESEVWALCLAALEGYRLSRGKLEHYLRAVARNKMQNLERDTGFGRRRASNPRRRALASAMSMGSLDISHEQVAFSTVVPCGDPADALLTAEFQEFIEKRLTGRNLDAFRRALSGERMDPVTLRRLRRLLRKILERWHVQS